MKKGMLFGLAIFALAVGLSVLPAAANGTPLWDGFTTAGLNLTKWDIVAGTETTNIETGVTDGALKVLKLASTSEARIDSDLDFGPDTFALARIKFTSPGGVSQAFGFNINTTSGLQDRAFFETSENTDKVRAKVFIDSSSVFDQEISATWGAYHIFKIEWSSAGTYGTFKFYVDGELKQTFALTAAISDALPVGFRNTKVGSTFNVDWAFITPFDVTLKFADFVGANGIVSAFAPNGIDNFSAQTNTDAFITSFTQVCGVLCASTMHTNDTSNDQFGIFVINEAPDTAQGAIDVKAWTLFTTPKNRTSAVGVQNTPPGTPGVLPNFLGGLGGQKALLAMVTLDPGTLFRGRQETIHLDIPFTRDAAYTGCKSGTLEVDVQVSTKGVGLFR